MSKGKRAYLVDPYEELITEVCVEDYRDILKHLRCDIFASAYRNRVNDDVMYVDDCSFLHNKPLAFFAVSRHYKQPIAGMGLLIGSTSTGEDKDVEENLLDFAMSVEWLTVVP